MIVLIIPVTNSKADDRTIVMKTSGTNAFAAQSGVWKKTGTISKMNIGNIK